MPQGILFTFLELADATSLNLEFSHLDGVHISYGEETITESNLLAIRRRHQNLVRVHTFTRRKEAQVGADWEWHLVGQKYTLSMRVQAKRVQSDGKLKIKHKIRSTGLFQYDQLMSAARANNMMPIYCIYCTAPQRSKWKHQHYSGNCREYQTGCLLAAADHVPNATVRLDQIESMSIPWHYLFFVQMLHDADLNIFRLIVRISCCMESIVFGMISPQLAMIATIKERGTILLLMT